MLNVYHAGGVFEFDDEWVERTYLRVEYEEMTEWARESIEWEPLDEHVQDESMPDSRTYSMIRRRAWACEWCPAHRVCNDRGGQRSWKSHRPYQARARHVGHSYEWMNGYAIKPTR